ncbi:MAG: WG repeat-containing protein [Planctomycetes bacterium]|nr:WG repeat-containing protein [Planctomycetota bacterium]
MRRVNYTLRVTLAVWLSIAPAPAARAQEHGSRAAQGNGALGFFPADIDRPIVEDPGALAPNAEALFLDGCRSLHAGSFEAARDCLTRALADAAATGEVRERVLNARALAHLGCLDLQAAYDDTLDRYDKSLGYRKTERMGDDEYTLRGVLYALWGDTSRSLLEFAAAFDSKHPERRIYATFVADGTELLRPLEDLAEWPGPVIRFLRKKCTTETLLAEAMGAKDESTRQRRLLDAHLALGVWFEREGKADAAERHFESAVATRLCGELPFLWAQGAIARRNGRVLPFKPLGENLHGYMDRDGREVIAPRFRYAGAFHNGTASVKLPWCERSEGLIDRIGKFLVPPIYESIGSFSAEGLATVQSVPQGPFGFVDRTGKVVIPIQFPYAREFTEGVALAGAPIGAAKAERYGFIDTSGAWAIEPRFAWAQPFAEGIARVLDAEDRHWHLIDRKGKEFGALRSFQLPEFSEGLAAVQTAKDDLFGYADQSGKLSIAPRFTEASKFSEGRAAVKSRDVHGGARWYYIDRAGSRIGTESCNVAREFKEGFGVIERDGRYGYCGLDGRVVIEPAFTKAHSFDEGFARVEQGGRHGFISPRGELLGATWFENVWFFHEGLAAVLTRTGWGFIDSKGVWAIPPTLDGDSSYREGVAGFHGPAIPEALQPIDPEDFPVHCRDALFRVQATQRFHLLMESMPAEICHLAATVEWQPFSDADAAHAQKILLLGKVRDAARADDTGKFYDELFSEQARADRYYWLVYRRNLQGAEVPEPIWRYLASNYEPFRAGAIRELRQAIAQGQLAATGKRSMKESFSPYLFQVLMRHVPEMRTEARAAFLADSAKDLESGRFKLCSFIELALSSLASGDDAFGFTYHHGTHARIWRRDKKIDYVMIDLSFEQGEWKLAEIRWDVATSL